MTTSTRTFIKEPSLMQWKQQNQPVQYRTITVKKNMEFSAEQLEDVKDAFEIFTKTTDLQIGYDQVGNVLRALKLNPSQEDVEKVLGNPTKEEMSSKLLKQEEFLPIYEKVLKECEVGTYDDLLEGLKVFDKEGNGTVMGGEIRHILRTLGEKMTVSEINSVMDGTEDMNGVLNIERLCPVVEDLDQVDGVKEANLHVHIQECLNCLKYLVNDTATCYR